MTRDTFETAVVVYCGLQTALVAAFLLGAWLAIFNIL